MSAAKRRNILVVFGGVAVLLAVALFFISPNFRYRNEDASGAIGAVQKHRQPQIQATDVVLGSEQVKKDQQLVYLDFLADAAALSAISADLESEAQSVDARKRLDAAAQSLDARKKDLQVRALDHADSAMVEIRKLGTAEAALEALDLDAVAVRVRNAAEALEAKSVEHRQLESAEAEVASFASRMNNEQLSLDAANRLQNAIDADNVGSRIRAQADYLEAMSRQNKALDAAGRSLAALQAQSLDARSFRSVSADLRNEAAALESQALEGMKRNLDSHAAAMDALGRMDAQLNAASNSLDSKLASSAQELAAMSRIVKGHAAHLQAQSSVEMRSQLQAASVHLDSRRISNKSLAAFSQHLGSLSQSVEHKSALASAMPDSADFAMQVKDLANRATADLQARNRQ